LLVPPPEITTFYEYLACDTYVIISTADSSAVVCTSTELYPAQVIPFRPPFFFNFVCFSTILTAYIPVFLYTYCLKLTFPILTSLLLAKFIDYDDLPRWVRRRTRGILWPSYWNRASPPSLRPADSLGSASATQEHSSLGESLLSDSRRSSPSSGPLPHLTASTPGKEFATPELLFKPSRVFGSITQDFCVLFTFGLCSPVLALAVALHASLSIFQTRIMISRFVSHRQQQGQPDGGHQYPVDGDAAITALERSLCGISQGFLQMVWPIVWSSCFFVAFLGWEISGDSTGWENSIWVPISATAIAITVQIVTFSPSLPPPHCLAALLRLLDRSFSVTPLPAGAGTRESDLLTDDQVLSRASRRYSDVRRSSIVEMT
jgi:hypothetical protein